MKQIDRLLVLQGQRCFFCDGLIPKGEASVEHLVASANGGTNDDINCVVCCKSLNTAFGRMAVKDKVRAVLNHCGPFICPGKVGTPEPNEPAHREDPRISLIVADLKRRGSKKPLTETTLRNTIANLFQNKLSAKDLSSLLARLKAKGFISIPNGKVTYNLPAKVA